MGNVPRLPEGKAAEALTGISCPKPALQVQTVWAGDNREYRSA